MRVFVLFQSYRHLLDVAVGQTVCDIKSILRKKFDLDTVQNEEGENDMLITLNYAGSNLEDDWVFTDISIPPGATLRCQLVENIKPFLFVTFSYFSETLRFKEWFDVWDTKVGDLKAMITEKTGLHVSVFRLVSPEGNEMYDCHPLKTYSIDYGDTIQLETWNGWNEFLRAATSGQLTPTLKHMVSMTDDPLVFKYQLRVALFIAAHFNYSQLATQLIKSGARCDEPVGTHPVREWCNKDGHPDHMKTPVHEAAQQGSLNCLQKFVHHNYACILAKDGHGLTPCNLARRYHRTECFKLLIAEQFRTRSTSGLTIGIYARVRKWCERARDRAFMFHKHSPNPLLLAMEHRTSRNAVVGQKVQIDGFGENMQAGASKLQLSMELKNSKNKPSTGVASSASMKSIQEGEKQGNFTGSDRFQTFNGVSDEEEGVHSTKSNEKIVAKNIEKQIICKTCSLPSVRQKTACCHGEKSRFQTSLRGNAPIRNETQTKGAALATNHYKAYRWKKEFLNKEVQPEVACFCHEHKGNNEKHLQTVEKINDLPVITTNSSLVGANKSDRISNIQICDNFGTKNPEGMKRDFFVTQEAAVDLERRRIKAGNNDNRDLDKSTANKNMPPINPQSASFSYSSSNDSQAKLKSAKRSKSDGELPRRQRSRSLYATRQYRPCFNLTGHRRASSDEKLSLQFTRMFSRVTGHDFREAAKESLDVAMTFQKKRWLQRVHMAIDFNNNTFARQLESYRDKHRESHAS